MSKGRVWNKGKHNGGTGSAEANKELAAEKLRKKLAYQQQEAGTAAGLPEAEAIPVNPVDKVLRMNRENWVERPARVKPQPKKE